MANGKLIFDKKNYTYLIAGIVILLLGFFIMTLDSEKYGFGFVGLTLGPSVVLLGFTILKIHSPTTAIEKWLTLIR